MAALRRFFALATLAWFACACAPDRAGEFTVRIVNADTLAADLGLTIEVCYPAQLVLSELAVNLYVTEGLEWSSLAGAPAYTEYINPQYVSIPGTVSNAIDNGLWRPSGDSCHLAQVENTFTGSEDWVPRGICPFEAVVVFASYRRGAWNAADIRECRLSD